MKAVNFAERSLESGWLTSFRTFLIQKVHVLNSVVRSASILYGLERIGRVKGVAGMSKCEECQKRDVYVHFGKEKLCLDCYNIRMEKQFGVAATSYPEGVSIRDGNGAVHHFLLRKRLDPLGVFMEAKEMVDGGYEFKL